jgi:DNA mismatch repair ATPase MutS
MVYFLISLAFLISIIIFLLKKRDEKILKHIQNDWGKEINKYRNFDLIEKYAVNNQSAHFHILSSQTLKDIDIESLFSILDRTLTGIGQQILYNKILFPTDNLAELNETENQSNYFKKEVAKRGDVQKILYKLEQNGTYSIVDIFKIKNTVIDKNASRHNLLTSLVIIGIVASFFFPLIAIYLLPIFAINITIHYIFKNRNGERFNMAGEVYGLIKCAERLQKTDTIIDSASIPEHLKSLNSFVNSYRFLNLGIPADDLSKAFFYLIELAKAAFLIDVHLLNRCYSQILQESDSIEELYKFIAEFDTAISIASLKSDTGFTTCTPVLISENKVLKFTNAIHPLIENCIPNSFSLENKSAFITGSNMSGKSTFLRTVLINSILAQTLFVCFAERYSSSFIKPFSSIKIEDDLLEGSSYFFKEVEIMKEMTEQISLPSRNIFIIDEVFKGTNTVERISLAKAILNFLNTSENIVIASSHDLELIELLSADFEMFHFTETIKDDHLNFDHTIKAGALKTTNAIKIVEIENFPESIIEEAYKMTHELKPRSCISN